jgi:hypothetical protein
MPGEELGQGFGVDPAKKPRVVATDATGRARLSGLARVPDLVIAARHPSYPAGGRATIDGSAPPAQPVKIVLARGATLAGVVIDVDGKPASDRDVVYRPEDHEVGRVFGEITWEGQHASTDAAGKFLFENLPPGEGRIDVVPKRAPPDSGTLNGPEREDCLERGQATLSLAAGKREDVRLQLVHTLAITGTVFDAAGKPLADVWLSINPSAANEGAWAQAARDGTYRLAGLAPGEYEVVVSRPSEKPDEELRTLTRKVAAGSRNVDFRFEK